jgi:hypothetical protein
MVPRERICKTETEMSTGGHKWKRRLAAAFVFIAILAGGMFWYLRGRDSPPIAAAGGVAFTNFAPIATPHYLQRDPQWKDDTIRSGETLGKVGCTVSSLAMALAHYGISFTPKTLNEALKTNEGYTRRGWLQWRAVTKISSGKVSVRVLDKPAHSDIDAALRAQNPVLVKVFINRVIPHWVIVVGKEGMDYLMRDPLNDDKTLTHVATYASDIYGVRIVEPTKEAQ